jgi:hypothetical protein
MPLSKEKMRIYAQNRRDEVRKQKALAKTKKGHPTKDSEILDNFNMTKENNLSRREEKQAMSQSEAEELSILGDDDEAYKLLKDMRWIYRTVGGRRKLKRLMKEDDKQFITMMKEMFKMESAIMASKLKRGDGMGGGDPSYFVILKGLRDTPVTEQTADGVDTRQIEHAINPNSDLVPMETEPEPDSPQEIIKPIETISQEAA